MAPKFSILLLAVAAQAYASAAEPAQASNAQARPTAEQPAPWFTRTLPAMPLYDGAIPNSKPTADDEKHTRSPGMGEFITDVSRPTYTAYLPAPGRANGTAVVIFPGGGYQGVARELEGLPAAIALQDRGIAAILVKYRLPSDATMPDKTIGPLQDAQQALIQVRRHAGEWGIDPGKVGVMGFSAGGHLASTVGTHFDKVLVDNPGGLSVRPDFMVLIYPVITMADAKTHWGSREALLGMQPTEAQIRRFSNELQVTARTPPAILVAAGDDTVVDVDNSISFYEALRHDGVPAELVLLPAGEHGFFRITHERWMAPVWTWLISSGWAKQ
jgi:acetyl esterase/lipase